MKRLFAVLLMAGLMCGVAGAVPRHHRGCERRIEAAEHKLHQAERKHGMNSRQAVKARHELESARSGCHDRH